MKQRYGFYCIVIFSLAVSNLISFLDFTVIFPVSEPYKKVILRADALYLRKLIFFENIIYYSLGKSLNGPVTDIFHITFSTGFMFDDKPFHEIHSFQEKNNSIKHDELIMF